MSYDADALSKYIKRLTERRHEDALTSLVSSLASVLDSRSTTSWPMDVIILVAMYARSRSVLIGSMDSYVTSIHAINPTYVRHAQQFDWERHNIPGLPMVGMIQYRFMIHDHIVIGIQSPWREQVDEFKLICHAAAISAIAMASSSTALASAHQLPDTDALSSNVIDGIRYGNEWKLSWYRPDDTNHIHVVNDVLYQFDFVKKKASYWKKVEGDETKQQWMPLQPMDIITRIPLSSCVWRDQIYFVGGNTHEKDGEILCFCTRTESWLKYKHNGLQRGGRPTLINIGDHIGILVMFDINSEDRINMSIELFEPHHNHKWSILKQLSSPYVHMAGHLWSHRTRCLYIDDGIVMYLGSDGNLWCIEIGDNADEVILRRTTEWYKAIQSPAHAHFSFVV
jgi:hypothetical protein